MKPFQQLMRAALVAGAMAGAVLFAFQYFFVVPRILAAERYEVHEGHAGHEGHHHEAEWKPAEGVERNYYTAASTVLTGIGYAALLVAIPALAGIPITRRNGWVWGLAGFVTFVGAPALGLPPEPPGVPVADLAARQVWWVLTVAATGAALLLVAKGWRRWPFTLAAGVLVLLPHLVGAPQAEGMAVVPADLIRDFSVVTVLGNGVFWLVVGPVAGLLE